MLSATNRSPSVAGMRQSLLCQAFFTNALLAVFCLAFDAMVTPPSPTNEITTVHLKMKLRLNHHPQKIKVPYPLLLPDPTVRLPPRLQVEALL